MASYTAAVDALTDVASGETLDEAGGGLGHAEVENRQNQAARDLAAWADDLGATSVTSVNSETGAVTLDADDVSAVPAATGVQYRAYDGGWPERGDVPTGTVVIWLKRDVADPDPPIDATYALTGVDLALLAQA